MNTGHLIERIAGEVAVWRGVSSRGHVRDWIEAFVKDALDAYKQRVLEAALDCQAEENWCDDGLHAALRKLDIEPPKREWEVSVEVKAYQNVVVKVQATSEDEAMRLANDMSWGAVMDAAAEAGNRWNHDAHEAEEAWVA